MHQTVALIHSVKEMIDGALGRGAMCLTRGADFSPGNEFEYKCVPKLLTSVYRNHHSHYIPICCSLTFQAVPNITKLIKIFALKCCYMFRN
jgi:hypothetical protein